MLPLADRRLSSWSEQVHRMDQVAGQWLSFLDKHQGKHLLIHLNEYAEFTSARECHAELGGLLPALDNLNHPAIGKFLEGQQTGASTLVKAGPAYSADDLALLVGHSWVSPVPWEK